MDKIGHPMTGATRSEPKGADQHGRKQACVMAMMKSRVEVDVGDDVYVWITLGYDRRVRA